jgi:excisionase family DNA binding protein
MLKKICQLLSLKEASEALGVSIFTLRRLVDDGSIRAINISARRLISAEEVQRVVANGAGKPRARNSRIRKKV